jgi:hypothetical protein
MSEVDDFLAHYGVTGMKWGRRKGGVKDRVKGAVADSIERRMVTNKAIADGKGQTRDFRRVALRRGGGFATGAVFATGNKHISEQRAKALKGQMGRLKKGKITRLDALDMAINTHPLDLVISRRDKRALPGAVEAKVNGGAKTAAKVLAGVGTAALLTLNTKQNRAVALHVLKLTANAAVGAAVNAKKKSNATAAYNTNRSNTHGITSHPTIRMHQNPTTGNWI